MIFGVKLTMEERNRLGELAKKSGRTPSSVFRRLLEYAETPEALRMLGISEGKTLQPAQSIDQAIQHKEPENARN